MGRQGPGTGASIASAPEHHSSQPRRASPAQGVPPAGSEAPAPQPGDRRLLPDPQGRCLYRGGVRSSRAAWREAAARVLCRARGPGPLPGLAQRAGAGWAMRRPKAPGGHIAGNVEAKKFFLLRAKCRASYAAVPSKQWPKGCVKAQRARCGTRPYRRAVPGWKRAGREAPAVSGNCSGAPGLPERSGGSLGAPRSPMQAGSGCPHVDGCLETKLGGKIAAGHCRIGPRERGGTRHGGCTCTGRRATQPRVGASIGSGNLLKPCLLVAALLWCVGRPCGTPRVA
jgi:hypothetical protein